jgi:hypothetical protein
MQVQFKEQVVVEVGVDPAQVVLVEQVAVE